jgi:hypothetical protein
MIFTGLSFLNQIMNVVIYNLLGYGVCQGCAVTMEIADGDVGSFCLANFPLPIGYEPNEEMDSRGKCFENTADESDSFFLGLPMFISNIIIFLIVVHLIKKFVTFAAEMADAITENFYGGMGSAGGGAYAFEQGVKSVVGQDKDSKHRRFDRQVYEERYKRLMDPAKIDIKAKDGEEEKPGTDIKLGGGKGGGGEPPDSSLESSHPDESIEEGRDALEDSTGMSEGESEDESVPRDEILDSSIRDTLDVPEEAEEAREFEKLGTEETEGADEADRSVPREGISDMDSDDGDSDAGDDEDDLGGRGER